MLVLQMFRDNLNNLCFCRNTINRVEIKHRTLVGIHHHKSLTLGLVYLKPAINVSFEFTFVSSLLLRCKPLFFYLLSNEYFGICETSWYSMVKMWHNNIERQTILSF